MQYEDNLNKIKELANVQGFDYKKEEELKFLTRYSHLLPIKYQATDYLKGGKMYDLTLETVLNSLKQED
jgi:hypothetical protein